MKAALYPGSFDPLTAGHIDVIIRAARLFDRLVVAVGCNTSKVPLFSVDERLVHLRHSCAGMENVEVASFAGLLTDAVKHFRVDAVVRGLRAVSDFEHEFQMALMNRELYSGCETIFLMPSPEYSYISSTMIREIARLGGDIRAFVPPDIAELCKERMSKQ